MLKFAILLALLFAVPVLNAAQPYQLKVLADNLNYPWALVFLPDGDMLLTERSGTVKRLAADGSERFSIEPALPGLMQASQAGLQDVILMPDFAANNQILLSYARREALELGAHAVCFGEQSVCGWRKGCG